MAIHLENEFTVPASLDTVWDYLLDPRRVAPCMPGAELTEILNDRQYKGRVHVKMGPVSLSFNGHVDIVERDAVAKRVVMKATGSEQKGKGQANATVTSLLEPIGNGTRMRITQDIDLTGPLAQYGRGMIQDVSGSLMDEFAGRIKAELSRSSAAVAGDGRPAYESDQPPAAAKPVSGFRLGWIAIKKGIARFFRRIFGFRDGA